MTDEPSVPPLPGALPTISAGLGDYASFKAEMLRLIPRVAVDAGGSVTRPLARLNLDLPSDPTLAMVDAFAALADIVSFYQDRVLNEGYLPTALDYSSLSLMARSLGENPSAYIGATAEIALFAQPGAPVSVPAGSVLQANPPKPRGSTASSNGGGNGNGPSATAAAASPTGTPVFETSAQVTVDPALNELIPLQTRPVDLDPATESLLIQGTGLGLAVGDFMLLVKRGKPTQWVRLTVFSVSENHVLVTTTIGIGSSLQAQWTASGCTEAVPRNAGEGLELYALDLTCRLFGYNAPSWSSQSAAVQRANTPIGVPPAEFTEWPGFGIDLGDLDLQAVYPKVLPGSQFLLETPEENTLGVIAAVARQNAAKFGLSGQVTEVALAPEPVVLPTGVALIPSRTGVSASLLGDGRVLLAGGIGDQGALDSVEVYDPSTGLLNQVARLPSPRGMHTATTVDGVVYFAGGVTRGADGRWRYADDILQLDLSTLTFRPIAGVTLAIPRFGHAALALPDDTLMLSGGLTGAAIDYAKLGDLIAAAEATKSVTVFAPNTQSWTLTAEMAHARAGHSATLCPVVKSAEQGGSASATPIGQVVVFLGGHDGTAMSPGEPPPAQPGRIWDDAEITDPTTWQPTGTVYPIQGDGKTGSARYDHVAVALPGNNGFAVTGGQSATGAVGDNWLVGAFATGEPSQTGSFSAKPVFVPAPPLVTARADHAAALIQSGKLLVAGGVAGSTILASVEIFAVDAGASIPFDGAKVLGPSLAGAALPQPQTQAAFLPLPGDKLLVAGGLGAFRNGYLNAVVAYDADVGTFSNIPGPILTTPSTLAPVGSIGLADGTILVLGATTPPAFPDQATTENAPMTGFAWTFDPLTNLSTVTGAPNVARVGATLSLLSNGTVLLAGGMGVTETGYTTLDTAEIYDPKSRSFRKVYGKMTVPRCGHTATVLADGSVLLVGGYSLPPVTYNLLDLLGVLVPGLDSAETFNVAQQAFTAAAATLPQGVTCHSATLLATGDVLIAGGASEFYAMRDFTSVSISPTGQAAIFNVSARSFAPIASLGTPRAQHSATLLTSGKVLIAGGAITSELTATAKTEIFDPARSTFTPSADLAEARRMQGAIVAPAGLLLIGGADTPSYEIIPADGTTEQQAYSLPFALPSPDYPRFVSLTETVTPIPISGRGIYTFGGEVLPDGTSTCDALLYVEAPPAPDSEARRQALVYTQSRPLYLAPPINDMPIEGATLVLTGLIDDIVVGQALLIAGQPPLATTVGTVTGIGGEPPLDPATVVMVLAPVASDPIGRGNPVASPNAASPAAPSQNLWWSAQVPDMGILSIETDPDAKPPSALVFLSGNGTTMGNVTAAQLALFTRPVQGEAVTVRKVEPCATDNTTILTLGASLRYLYDRTTTTVYGNVVEATQGSTVEEVLGDGNGQRPFMQFMLKQAPLTWLEEADGSIAPQLQVAVNGMNWDCVPALGDCGPDARAYQLTQDAQGRARIQFGDGVHGLRPPTGANNITASYRVGGGPDGNVPAGTLTRPPVNVAGIKGILNPVGASGGVGPLPRGMLRGEIPVGVADLGRIVTQDDMVSFVLDRPEIGATTCSTERESTVGQDAKVVNLITLAGLNNEVPDPASSTFASLTAAFTAALASGAALPHRLLPFAPTPFKVGGTFTIAGTADIQQVQSAIDASLRRRYALGTMGFERAVRATEIVAAILRDVPNIATATVTALWIPTEGGPLDQRALYPKKATLTPLVGAQILCLSVDADAVAFVPAASGGNLP